MARSPTAIECVEGLRKPCKVVWQVIV